MSEPILALLMAQAESRGAELVTLRALVEESSQAGARRALGALGLDDARARRDMDELRGSRRLRDRPEARPSTRRPVRPSMPS